MDDNENLNNDDLSSSMFSAGDDDAKQAESMFSSSSDEANQDAPMTSMFDEADTKADDKPSPSSDVTTDEAEQEAEINAEETEKEPIEVVDDKEEDADDEEEAPNDVVTVRPVKFKKFEATPPIRTIKKNLDIMQDISMHISVELGRAKLSIKEVMDFEKGSIVELNKIAGEQVEVFVNGKLVAKGEVIVIEDRFGVRITSTNIGKNPASP